MLVLIVSVAIHLNLVSAVKVLKLIKSFSLEKASIGYFKASRFTEFQVITIRNCDGGIIIVSIYRS